MSSLFGRQAERDFTTGFAHTNEDFLLNDNDDDDEDYKEKVHFSSDEDSDSRPFFLSGTKQRLKKYNSLSREFWASQSTVFGREPIKLFESNPSSEDEEDLDGEDDDENKRRREEVFEPSKHSIWSSDDEDTPAHRNLYYESSDEDNSPITNREDLSTAPTTRNHSNRPSFDESQWTTASFVPEERIRSSFSRKRGKRRLSTLSEASDFDTWIDKNLLPYLSTTLRILCKYPFIALRNRIQAGWSDSQIICRNLYSGMLAALFSEASYMAFKVFFSAHLIMDEGKGTGKRNKQKKLTFSDTLLNRVAFTFNYPFHYQSILLRINPMGQESLSFSRRLNGSSPLVKSFLPIIAFNSLEEACHYWNVKSKRARGITGWLISRPTSFLFGAKSDMVVKRNAIYIRSFLIQLLLFPIETFVLSSVLLHYRDPGTFWTNFKLRRHTIMLGIPLLFLELCIDIFIGEGLRSISRRLLESLEDDN